jgi:hypothetical protein
MFKRQQLGLPRGAMTSNRNRKNYSKKPIHKPGDENDDDFEGQSVFNIFGSNAADSVDNNAMDIKPTQAELDAAAAQHPLQKIIVTNFDEAVKNVELYQMHLKINADKTQGFDLITDAYKTYTDYSFFKWVIYFCKIREQMITSVNDCFVKNNDDIIKYHGIVADKLGCEIFTNFVRDFLYAPFQVVPPSKPEVFSLEYPARELYPTPLSFFHDMRNKLPKCFGDRLEKSSIRGITLKELYFHEVDNWFELREKNAEKLEELLYEPEDEAYEKSLHKPEVFSSLSITDELMKYAEKIVDKMYHMMYDESGRPINILSVLNSNGVKISEADAFIEKLRTTRTSIIPEVQEFLSYAKLIEINNSYQQITDWDNPTTLNTYTKNKIHFPIVDPIIMTTSWRIDDWERLPQILGIQKKRRYERRLAIYENNLLMLNMMKFTVTDERVKSANANLSLYTPDKQYNIPIELTNLRKIYAGGSKTKKQRKQRRRKQKSKRKKN